MNVEGENIAVEGLPGGDAVRTDGGGKGLDTLLALVSSRRRRHALYYLRESETASVDELAKRLTESTDTISESPSTDQLSRTKVELVHAVLPKLQEAGCIDYDPRSETIRYRRPSTSLTTVLDVCSDLESTPMEFE
ncbi:DUF7344 domain-containing protein [Natrinema marinum]|uniref:DUF7344 domain-containing protein n=1 Tax=Natrinema marinum TaxID=2961598 RepID=UPI0020C87819|nr:hypothetical protein [Natrinema marinum]